MRTNIVFVGNGFALIALLRYVRLMRSMRFFPSSAARFTWLLLALVCALCACSSNGHRVSIVVASDLAPGDEAAHIITRLMSNDAANAASVLQHVEATVLRTMPLARGVRVATFDDVPSGEALFQVVIQTPSAHVLLERPVIANVQRDMTITIVMSANCLNMHCPNEGDADAACLNGQCVDSRCTAEDRQYCDQDSICTNDDQCIASSPCAQGACSYGLCLSEPRPDACEQAEYCAREQGCVPIDGPVDGSEDPRCGTICFVDSEPCKYGYFACAALQDGEQSVQCRPFLSRVAGTSCGQGLVCNANGECVASAAPDAGADADVDASADADVDASIDATVDAESETQADAWPEATTSSPCSVNNGGCDPRTSCTDVDGEAVCGPCPSGLRGNGYTECVDIDECLTRACGTTAVCVNTVGSYECGCAIGRIELEGACVDVNECMQAEACASGRTCSNQYGAYACDEKAIDLVYASSAGTCVRYVDGGTKCWGYNTQLRPPRPQSNYMTWSGEVAAFLDSPLNAFTTQCARLTSGAVECHGSYPGAVDDLCDTWAPAGCASASGNVAIIDSFADANALFWRTGVSNACFVDADRRLFCWGSNGYGQLAQPAAPPYVSATPIEIALGDEVTSVTTPSSAICATLADDSLWCWGKNDHGQLGVGHYASLSTPTRVSIWPGARIVRGSGSHMCAISTGGVLLCWGDNTYGQLGFGDNADHPVTVEVSLPSAPLDVAVSGNVTCALLATGGVQCWGSNASGIVSDEEQESYNLPVSVPLSARATQITLSTSHACALLETGRIECWGNLNFRDLPSDESVPDIRLPNNDSLAPRHTDDVFLGADVHNSDRVPSLAICARTQDAEMRCSLDLSNQSAGTPLALDAVEVQTSTSRIGGADSWGCARTADGDLWCMGANESGQLGVGDTLARAEFVQVELGGATVDLALGYEHSCALREDGKVFCFGLNDRGQLGIDGVGDRLVPLEATALSRSALEITTSYYSTCARLDDGSVECWGPNTIDTDRPDERVAHIALAGPAIALDAGHLHFCAVLQDGRLQCWGSNAYGQLGIPATGPYTTIPPSSAVPLTFEQPVLDVALGHTHTCVLLEGGSVKCWGNNDGWQLGDGGTTTRDEALAVSLPTPARQLRSGAFATCAILLNDDVFCWGTVAYASATTPRRVLW